MKLAIKAIQDYLNDYRTLCSHARLNRMVEFTEQELPIVLEEMLRQMKEKDGHDPR